MTRNTARITGASLLALGVLLLCTLPLAAQDQPKPIVNTATASGVTPALRELAKLPQPLGYGFHEANPVRYIPKGNFGTPVDPVEQRGTAPTANYSILANFLGVGNGFPGYTDPDAPPDTNMAVGPTQIIQWVNVQYTICNKTTTACSAFINGNALWAAGIPGTACATHNAGDPLAQFDTKANRWLLSQNVFSSPYEVCIAISDTSDATGTWHVWQFPVPGSGFPDYPKLGIWPTGGVNNGYYEAVNNFGPGGGGFVGPQICAYDRAAMLSGAPSPTQICFQLHNTEDSLLPGDLDSNLGVPNTPGGTPQDEFYIGSVADVDNSHLSLYQFHADFTTPASSFVLGSPNTILQSVPTYVGVCGGAFGGACVPSLGGTAMDTLGDRLMYRFAYWNDGPAPNAVPCAICGGSHSQHWYVNGAVEASGGQGAERWYEFRAPPVGITTLMPTTLTTFQASTYAPDSSWRWMGSLTQDKKGNILLGYSTSSSTTHPAIDIAGRVPADPINTLETEALVVQGNGSQTDTASRWGDYSSMRIDLNDGHSGCTFWYTTEYYMVTASFDWSTQIASAKFSTCN